MLVCTMGMFIVDDNEYWDRPPITDKVGGAGPYFMVGARIIAGARYADKVGGVIDMGTDFPASVATELQSWHTSIVFRKNPERLTTRGVNYYDENDIRHFRYVTPKRQLFAPDLAECGLMSYEWYHLICLIERAFELVEDISRANPKARFIYEPLPTDCVASTLSRLKKLLPSIAVFTPNLDEARSLCSEVLDKDASVAAVALVFRDHLGVEAGVVLRLGPEGVYVCASEVLETFPAYHTSQAKVVDVTGGGNSYCGGFIMGLVLSQGDWRAAAVSGNVASGCVIELFGFPRLQAAETVETWNGMTTSARFTDYLERNQLDIPVDWLQN